MNLLLDSGARVPAATVPGAVPWLAQDQAQRERNDKLLPAEMPRNEQAACALMRAYLDAERRRLAAWIAEAERLGVADVIHEADCYLTMYNHRDIMAASR